MTVEGHMLFGWHLVVTRVEWAFGVDGYDVRGEVLVAVAGRDKSAD